MKKHNILTILLAIILTVFGTSCKKDQEIGGTAVQKMSGDWYVLINGDTEEGHFTMYTFNTSDNSSTQIWIQANSLATETGGIGVKGKMNVDLNSMTFSGTNVTNIGSSRVANPTFAVANGKVTTNGTVGPVSNTPTDLISFDLIIGGKTYKIEGYHKTGFVQDVP
ncbi:MAG TPA: lipid-binding protein [Pedobacter sp.]|nr:lipid-binding protein [Pedobacter sp.]